MTAARGAWAAVPYMPKLSVVGRPLSGANRGHASGRPVAVRGVLRRPSRSPTTTNHRRDHARGFLPSTSIRPDGLRGVIEVPAAADDHLGASQIMIAPPQGIRARSVQSMAITQSNPIRSLRN